MLLSLILLTVAALADEPPDAVDGPVESSAGEPGDVPAPDPTPEDPEGLTGEGVEDGTPSDSVAPENGELSNAPDTSAPTEGPASFVAEVESARSTYFAQGPDLAGPLFAELVERAETTTIDDEESVLVAYAYLGEINYLTGDQAAAWDTFERLLQRRPDHVLSPYHHPAEVIAWFELVRRQLEQRTEPPEPPVEAEPAPRLPAWGYLPLGLPQVGQSRNGRAAIWAGLQLSAASASIGLNLYLRDVNGKEGWPDGTTAEERHKHINGVRFGAQIPATVAFYGLWAGSVLDARHHWREDHRAPTVSVLPLVVPALGTAHSSAESLAVVPPARGLQLQIDL